MVHVYHSRKCVRAADMLATLAAEAEAEADAELHAANISRRERTGSRHSERQAQAATATGSNRRLLALAARNGMLARSLTRELQLISNPSQRGPRLCCFDALQWNNLNRSCWVDLVVLVRVLMARVRNRSC